MDKNNEHNKIEMFEMSSAEEVIAALVATNGGSLTLNPMHLARGFDGKILQVFEDFKTGDYTIRLVESSDVELEAK